MRGLTVVNPEIESFETKTAAGMAHWAGTGPEGATCGKCVFYGYSYRKENGDVGKRNTACEKFFKMMRKHGDALRKDQSACRHFDPVEQPSAQRDGASNA